MKNKVQFCGNGDDPEIKGKICYEGPFSDYTLCGLSLDNDSGSVGWYVHTDEKINCLQCLAIIDYCKDIIKKEKL